MRTMDTDVTVFLADGKVSEVAWDGPRKLKVPGPPRWYAQLTVDCYPAGKFRVGFHGTEAQVKAVRGDAS